MDVYGAEGSNRSVFARGGLGGRRYGTITVTPGEVITIVVGGQGTDTPPTADCVLTGGTGTGGFGMVGATAVTPPATARARAAAVAPTSVAEAPA